MAFSSISILALNCRHSVSFKDLSILVLFNFAFPIMTANASRVGYRLVFQSTFLSIRHKVPQGQTIDQTSNKNN